MIQDCKPNSNTTKVKVKNDKQSSYKDGKSSNQQCFDISVKFIPTGEIFHIQGIHNDLRINELKEIIEYESGIPTEIQVITYLDKGDLPPHSDIKHSDVVPNSQLILDVRSEWRNLIIAVVNNDESKVLALGVQLDDSYSSPAMTYMSAADRHIEKCRRALLALYLAAHRGNAQLCQTLISIGADVNGDISQGRRVLQIASSQGHGKIIDLLLQNGADIDAKDNNGETALSVAVTRGHKSSERHLFLFRWQQRARVTRPRVIIPRFAHQYYDSATPVWLKGKRAQLYFAQVLPAGEYEGSHFSAPKRKHGPLTENLGRKSRTLCAEKPYTAWLTDKETIEIRMRLIEKDKREKLKQDNEDKKRLVEMQDKSYDQWLTSKEQQKHPATAKKRTQNEKENTATTLTSLQAHHGGSLSMTEIMKNIRRRRELLKEEEEEMDNLNNKPTRTKDIISDDQWLTLSSTELYQKLKHCSLPSIFT